MDDRTKKIGIVILILLIIAIIALIFLSRKPAAEPAPAQTPGVTLTPENSEGVVPETLTPNGTPIAPEERNVMRFSMQFAERYGSFSSESNYQNLIDLKPVMTVRMQQSVDAFIATQQESSEFYGVTTQAVSGVVESQTDASATVLVSTQRTETKGTSTSKSFAQQINVKLVKSGIEWKVDQADWIVVE